MQSVTLVGIDLGKHSFHLHGQDRHGKAVFRKKMNRKQLFEFFERSTRARWSWKRAWGRTIWRASLADSDIR